jgi:hypothetical protein
MTKRAKLSPRMHRVCSKPSLYKGKKRTSPNLGQAVVDASKIEYID